MPARNPYAPPTAELDQAILAPVLPKRKWLQWLITLQFVVIFFAAGFAAVDIGSIVVSGPFFSLVGIVIAVFAARHRNRVACLYGISAVVFAFFVFALIFFNDWRPIAASTPVLTLILIYGFAALAVTLFLVLNQSSIVRMKTGIGISGNDEHHRPAT